MKVILSLVLIVVLASLGFGTLTQPALVYADINSTGIPNWVKGIAGYWAEGEISDSDFQQAIQFLVDNGVIKVKNATSVIDSFKPRVESSNSTHSQQVNGTLEKKLPIQTLRETAYSWSKNNISDSEYFKLLKTDVSSGVLGVIDTSSNVSWNDQCASGQITLESIKSDTWFSTRDVVAWVHKDGMVDEEAQYVLTVKELYVCGFINFTPVQVIQKVAYIPKTVIVKIPMEQDNQTITVHEGDSIKFVNVDSRSWAGQTIIGTQRLGNTQFSIGLLSLETLESIKNSTDYSSNLKLPNDTVQLIRGTWDCTYYFTNDHVGKSFTIIALKN